MSRSLCSEASTYGLARSGDGDNRRTCHVTVYCFSPENVVYLWENTKVFSLNRIQLVLNRNGKMTDNNNKDHTRSI